MRSVLTLCVAAGLLAACGQAAPETGSDAPAAPAAAASPAFATGSMPIHPVQVNATLTSLTGVDTVRAAMNGRVTEADAREFCERDPNGDAARSSQAECVSQTLASETADGATGEHTARADCAAGTLDSSDWGEFRLTGAEPNIVNADGAQVTGNADGGASAQALFEVLCPTRAAAWKASQ